MEMMERQLVMLSAMVVCGPYLAEGGRYSDPNEHPELVIPLSVMAVVLAAMVIAVVIIYCQKKKQLCRCTCCRNYCGQTQNMESGGDTPKCECSNFGIPTTSTSTVSDQLHASLAKPEDGRQQCLCQRYGKCVPSSNSAGELNPVVSTIIESEKVGLKTQVTAECSANTMVNRKPVNFLRSNSKDALMAENSDAEGDTMCEQCANKCRRCAQGFHGYAGRGTVQPLTTTVESTEPDNTIL